MVMRACREGLPSLILCPPNISGPNSIYLVGLVDALRHGEFALLEDGFAPCNLVDVSNLSLAIDLALSNGPADGPRLFVTDDENTNWKGVIDSLVSLTGSEEPAPSVTREQLSRAGDGEEKSPRSVLKSLKHLISSDVRQALRKDPGWATVDTVLRRGVTRMGKTV